MSNNKTFGKNKTLGKAGFHQIHIAMSEYDALKQVADAALAIYVELGTRLSPAAFDDLSKEAKTALDGSLKNLHKLKKENI